MMSELTKMALLVVLLSLSLFALISLVQVFLQDKFRDAVGKMPAGKSEKGEDED